MLSQSLNLSEGFGAMLIFMMFRYSGGVVFHRGIPFPVALEKRESIPNDETIEAFKWTENYIKSGKKNN